MIDPHDFCYVCAGYTAPRLPNISELLAIAAKFRVVIFKEQAWPAGPQPPYPVPTSERLNQWRYITAAALRLDPPCRIIPYCSPFYAQQAGLTPQQFLDEAHRIHDLLACDGLYLDGTAYDWDGTGCAWTPDDNWAVAELLRREWPDGMLVLHCTGRLKDGTYKSADNQFMLANPRVEALMSILALGEGCPRYASERAIWYEKTQILPRSSWPWAMLNQSWSPTYLVKLGAVAVGYVQWNGQVFDDGGQVQCYTRMIAARQAVAKE